MGPRPTGRRGGHCPATAPPCRRHSSCLPLLLVLLLLLPLLLSLCAPAAAAEPPPTRTTGGGFGGWTATPGATASGTAQLAITRNTATLGTAGARAPASWLGDGDFSGYYGAQLFFTLSVAEGVSLLSSSAWVAANNPPLLIFRSGAVSVGWVFFNGEGVPPGRGNRDYVVNLVDANFVPSSGSPAGATLSSVLGSLDALTIITDFATSASQAISITTVELTPLGAMGLLRPTAALFLSEFVQPAEDIEYGAAVAADEESGVIVIGVPGFSAGKGAFYVFRDIKGYIRPVSFILQADTGSCGTAVAVYLT